jgi:hypothetical protein
MRTDNERIEEMVGMMNGKMPKKKKVVKYVDDEAGEGSEHEAGESKDFEAGEEEEAGEKKKGLFGRAKHGLKIMIHFGRKAK